MFYIKKQVSDDIGIKIDIYDDEIFTQCPKCGKEIQVDNETLVNILKDADLSSTSLYCGKCSKEVK